ncbi:hypothetical protein [Mycoplasma suis]|uniref:Uncharacterized protein n=1 Tax=Mycoplasma suis (strain Illinois) TaxID=768700 RepID=F0QQK2_MYCSL|nr:hypothetical protein [Mycoplasma suis]ADX97772.1 hypothetical protein MSU_0228 [Mycoplasma suis str. Illinois]
MFRGISGLWWSLIIGASSAVAAGGAGAISYFGKESIVDLSHSTWYDQQVKDDKDITFAEFIVKKPKSDDKEICKRWKEGKVVSVTQEECRQIIKDKWNDRDDRQPELWFNADEKSIEKVLWNHFSNEHSELERSVFSGETWKAGNMKCTKKVSEEPKRYIEVSCAFEESREPEVN